MYIVRVCYSLRNSKGEKERQWSYELTERDEIKKLMKKYYYIDIIGKVIDEKMFSRGSLEQTIYRVILTENKETFIRKFRIDALGSWSIIVKSFVNFNEINSFDDAELAFKKAFSKSYPANCIFLAP
jgi:hypothetical protein